MMNDDLWDRADALAVARGFEPAFSAYKLYTNKGCSRHEFDERMAILDEVIREDATSASDARYQGRIKELEEALRLIEDHHNETEEWRDIAHKALSPTTPDTALQKALLEARIKELEEALQALVNTVNFSQEQTTAIVFAEEALSTTTPDTALQRIVLEARIDQVWQCENYNGVQLDALSESLHKQLEALGE